MKTSKYTLGVLIASGFQLLQAGLYYDIRDAELTAAISKADDVFVGKITELKKSYLFGGHEIELTDDDLKKLFRESQKKEYKEKPYEAPISGISIIYDVEITVVCERRSNSGTGGGIKPVRFGLV